MNKFILLLSICQITFPVYAQGMCSSYNLQDEKADCSQEEQESNENSDSDGQELFYNEFVEPYYGSTESPAFLNRENINPNESDYGYGSTDGIY